MSLFQVRDFWSIDLDHLRQHTSDPIDSTSPSSRSASPQSSLTTDTKPTNSCQAQFIVSIGRFSSIGSQDVFVCGSLQGTIYIIQVPEADQTRFARHPQAPRTHNDDRDDESSSISDERLSPMPADMAGRQLLASTDLGVTIVDLKCSYFTSALKQSIAVLSPTNLHIMTVKRLQIDLMTGPNLAARSGIDGGPNLVFSLEQSILSHELEEYVRLDLLANEFAYGLTIIDHHADSSLVDGNEQIGRESINNQAAGQKKYTERRRGFHGVGKQVVQQLHLPQRDKIVVQYTNQLAFTMIDGKKVLGHFRIKPQATGKSATNDEHKTEGASKLSEKCHYFGAMPMAHLVTGQKWSQSALIVSLSDYCLYCLPMDKLAGQAKQDVLNQVVMDLLSLSGGNGGGANKKPAESDRMAMVGQEASLIEIDLENLSEWRCEISGLPLQMQGLQRRVRGGDGSTSNQHQQLRDRLVMGELLVMTRYCLDLISGSGEHIWHQRFEAPLICLYAYLIDHKQPAQPATVDPTGGATKHREIPSDEDEKKQRRNSLLNDQIVAIICSAGLREDRSNLMVLKDDQMSWSAIVSSNPLQVWRLNLTRMSGLIATLDVKRGHLIASYMGTNLDPLPSEDEGSSASDQDEGIRNLIELERLNEPLFREETPGLDNLSENQRPRLVVANHIEMGSSDELVNVCTSIRLHQNTKSVVHDIVITYEFDDSFKFSLTTQGKPIQVVEFPARGVAEVRVGNCWPDRREALKIDTTFILASALSAKLVGAAAMNQFTDEHENHASLDDLEWSLSRNLMPKSLKVMQYVTFNETHSGSLHQEHSFLLPLGVVAQLTHVDYTSGQGQELKDVLNNLTNYKWNDGHGPSPYLCCDLFLGLDCDLISLLQEFVEGDLICRGKDTQSNKSAAPANTRPWTGGAPEKRAEVLDSINMLAQSLDCRIRYMSPSPSGMARQSSEELVCPKIITFALRLNYNFANLSSVKLWNDRTINKDERTVWIHICDLSTSDENGIITDLIDMHMKSWMDFSGKSRNSTDGDQQMVSGDQQDNNSRVLISIECQQPMDAVFVLSHLTSRLESLQDDDCSLNMQLIRQRADIDIRRHITDKVLKRGIGLLAISRNLHDALVSILNAYNNEHKYKFGKMQSDLTKEFGKYQVATDGLLSMSKRLSGLPDEMSGQLIQLTMQAKEIHQKIMSLLDELEVFKRLEVELAKLPTANVIELYPLNDAEPVLWSGLE